MHYAGFAIRTGGKARKLLHSTLGAFPARGGAFYVRSFFAAVMTLALGGIVRAETYNIQVWPDDLDKFLVRLGRRTPMGASLKQAQSSSPTATA
jgi:hypothetical protein